MQEIFCLSPDECLKATTSVFKLRKHWLKPKFFESDLPFYTLGIKMSYFRNKRYELFEHFAINDLLLEHFQWLYDKLEQQLEEYLEKEVVCDPDHSLPGFFISYTRRRIINDEPLRDKKLLSFVLPLKLPQEGGNVQWDLKIQHVEKAPPGSLLLKNPQFSHSLKLGHIILQSGHHHINPPETFSPRDKKILLHGHLSYNDRKWILSW